jgi:Arc/MetJ-type ribon-helix-helix transcriptional regulator
MPKEIKLDTPAPAAGSTLATQKVTANLPTSLFEELMRFCNLHFRTRSDVIRTALRAYFDQRRSGVTPTRDELSHLNQERTDFRRGSSESLKRFVEGMQSLAFVSGAKSILKSAAKRVGPHDREPS